MDLGDMAQRHFAEAAPRFTLYQTPPRGRAMLSNSPPSSPSSGRMLGLFANESSNRKSPMRGPVTSVSQLSPAKKLQFTPIIYRGASEMHRATHDDSDEEDDCFAWEAKVPVQQLKSSAEEPTAELSRAEGSFFGPNTPLEWARESNLSTPASSGFHNVARRSDLQQPSARSESPRCSSEDVLEMSSPLPAAETATEDEEFESGSAGPVSAPWEAEESAWDDEVAAAYGSEDEASARHSEAAEKSELGPALSYMRELAVTKRSKHEEEVAENAYEDEEEAWEQEEAYKQHSSEEKLAWRGQFSVVTADTLEATAGQIEGAEEGEPAAAAFLEREDAAALVALAGTPPSLPLASSVRLGDEWRSTTDGRGRRYYYNRRTRETSWVAPPQLVKVESPGGGFRLYTLTEEEPAATPLPPPLLPPAPLKGNLRPSAAPPSEPRRTLRGLRDALRTPERAAAAAQRAAAPLACDQAERSDAGTGFCPGCAGRVDFMSHLPVCAAARRLQGTLAARTLERFFAPSRAEAASPPWQRSREGGRVPGTASSGSPEATTGAHPLVTPVRKQARPPRAPRPAESLRGPVLWSPPPRKALGGQAILRGGSHATALHVP